jgi:hypothetical protein
VNSAEAKQILIAHRPGREEAPSAEVEEALALLREDAELRAWWQQQQSFHICARRMLLDVPVPDDLRGRLKAQRRIVPVVWWRRPAVLSAAAAMILLLIVSSTVWRSGAREDSIDTFRSRMVRNVLRQYRMDVTTSDPEQVRKFLAQQGAPADYEIPAALKPLPVMGGGVLSWKDQRVSMVCVDGGKQGTLFLFVVDANSLRNPPRQREYASVSSLATASWTARGKTYVLATSAGVTALDEWL